MKRYGEVVIRKKFKDEELSKELIEILKEVTGKVVRRKIYVDRDGYIVKDGGGSPIVIFAGCEIGITLAKNSKGRISCIAIRFKPERVKEGMMKKLVSGIIGFAGGTFHG